MPRICPLEIKRNVLEANQAAVHCPAISPASREIVTLAAGLLQVRPGARKDVEEEEQAFLSPPSLQELSARAVCGGVESIEALEELLCQIQDFNARTDGVAAKALLDATPWAVRESVLSLRAQAGHQFLTNSKEGGTPLETIRQRFEIVHDAAMKWEACGLVAEAFELENKEREWLGLCTVRHFGIPRVQNGESWKQVLMDLDIAENRTAENLLQAFAIKGPGVLRVKNGEDWSEVLISLDVDPDKKLRRSPEPNVEYILRKAALFSQGVTRVRNGEDMEKIQVEYGFAGKCPCPELAKEVHIQLRELWANYNELPQEPAPEEHYQRVIKELAQAYPLVIPPQKRCSQNDPPPELVRRRYRV